MKDSLEGLFVALQQDIAKGKIAGIEADGVKAGFLFDQEGMGDLTMDELLVEIDSPVKVA